MEDNIPERNRHLVISFFRYIVAGFLILCLKIKIKDQRPEDIVKTLFFTFWYCFTISIWIGLAGMLTMELYGFLKKNSYNILSYNV